MNRCRPYRFVHPLRGCGNTRGNALYRDVSPNGDKGCNNQHLGARHVPATMLPQLGDNTHILFTATPPRCDDTTTTLHSPFSILNSSFSHTFSAKERDTETGLSYFGSRYYSSDLSIWLSVDPMSDKYPSLSPYVYCADNPVRLVDPNGEDWYIPENSTTPIWDKDVTRKNCPQNATYLGVEGCTYDGKIITHYQKDGEIKQYSASNSIRKGGFTFPVGTMTDSYKSGYAQFGTNRSNGTRKHTGCDLYAAVGTPVFAVSQGTVFEKAHFYKGTYSIAINHGSFSARYCELIPSFNVQVGMQVAEGDFLGMIGKMEGLSQSMLHFEMYNNSESGPLTNKTNGSPYFRRGDLMNPTSYLDNIRLGDYEKVPKCIYR